MPTNLAQAANQWLPELNGVSPKNSTVLLSELVSHTAGLANELHNTTNLDGAQFDLNETEWFQKFAQQTFEFAPGSLQAYSGVAAELEGLMVGRLSTVKKGSAHDLVLRNSYNQFVTTNIFEPLGMTSSSLTLPTGAYAQNWLINYALLGDGATTYNFTPGLAPKDPGVISIAGGFGGVYTNIHDLARFVQMWLSPTVATHGVFSASQSTDAWRPETPLLAPAPALPASCATSGFTGADNNFYANCTNTGGFGVNWYVGNAPAGCTNPSASNPCNYIEYTGDAGDWGSMVRMHPQTHIAATALIATEGAPNAGGLNPSLPQPAGLDPGFIWTLTYGMLDSAMTADQSNTTWLDSPAAVGVARALYLSGSPTVDPSGQPNLLESQFTSAFLSTHDSSAAAFSAYLSQTFQVVGSCDSFRVRTIDDRRNVMTIGVRLHCASGARDMLLSIEDASPYQINGVTEVVTATQPY